MGAFNRLRRKTMEEKSTRIIRLAIVMGLIALAVLLGVILKNNPKGLVYQFLILTHVKVNQPAIYGLFHFICLIICVALGVFAVAFRNKITPEQVQNILFYSGVFLFVLETYKQFYYYYVIYPFGEYNFGILPLQVCSYSLYLFLIIPLLKDGVVKRALTLFCALYQTMGGCIVMFYPRFYGILSINLFTMVWHTVMIFNGITLLFKSCYKASFIKDQLPACIVFLITFVIANLLNVCLSPYTATSPEPLNLFYVSPHVPCNYIIIGDVQKAFGWFASVLCYGLMFTALGAPVVWLIGYVVKFLTKKINGAQYL